MASHGSPDLHTAPSSPAVVTWALGVLTSQERVFCRVKARKISMFEFISRWFNDCSVGSFIIVLANFKVGEGKLLHFLGNAVRGSFLVQCVQEITVFATDYDSM